MYPEETGKLTHGGRPREHSWPAAPRSAGGWALEMPLQRAAMGVRSLGRGDPWLWEHRQATGAGSPQGCGDRADQCRQ